MSGGDGTSVVVVGAGLAGLGAAIHLARAGHRVTVLEASSGVGGCCSTHTVEGYTFNNGALYVALPSALRSAFGRLGLDLETEVPLVEVEHPHRTVLDDGTIVHLERGGASRVEGRDGARRTDQLRRDLETLRSRWAPVYRTLVEDILPAPPSMPRALGKLWRYLPRMGGSVEALLSSHFSDPAAQAAIASTLLYTGMAPARLPATQILAFLALVEEGLHLPLGGMGMITAALGRAAARHSVAIRTGATVERLRVSGGRLRAVELSGGERLEASKVVATCSGFELVARLLGAEDVPPRLARRARRAPLSHRAIAIQLGCRLDGDPGAFIVSHVPGMSGQGRMHVTRPGVPDWLAYTHPSATLPGLAPPGRAVIECHAPASGIASAAEWTPAMTRRTVDDYVEGLRRKRPDLSIDTLRVMDPVAYATGRHLYEGALYGVAPGATPSQLFPHRTGIRGLYLAGQTTFPGFGVAPALMSGLQASEALLADG